MSSSSEPSAWFIVAAVFIALFVLVLIASGLVLSYLHHKTSQRESRGKPPASNNPHPFGTLAWHDHEEAQCSQAERNAIEMADLEAQVSMLEEAGDNLDKIIELMEIKNKRLEQELAEERRKFEPIDPEVFHRIYEEMHRPIQRSQSPQPPAELFLQLTKVRSIVDENLKVSPEQETDVEHIDFGISSKVASLVDPSAFEIDSEDEALN